MMAQLAILLMAVAPHSQADAAPPRPRLSPAPASELESRLLADCRDGQLDDHSLLEAALIAGGVEDAAELARGKRQFHAAADKLRGSWRADDSVRLQAAALLNGLHRRLLTGEYRLSATSPADTLDNGNYNCVSATILFQCLADEFGLSCQAIGRPEHAFNRVLASGDFREHERIDVETTCRDWFVATARSNAANRAMPATLAPEERELSAVDLLAAVYYNRGHERLLAGDYPLALAGNWHALELDPKCRQARDNLLATINNWALHMAESGDLRAALDLLSAGERLAPEHESFRVNLRLLRQRVR